MDIIWITKNCFDSIKENSDLFSKSVRDHFDFSGKNLTHWKVFVDSPKDYLIDVWMMKQGGNKKILTMNASGDRVATYIWSNINSKDRGSKDYYRLLDELWLEINKESIMGLFLSFEREVKLNSIIY